MSRFREGSCWQGANKTNAPLPVYLLFKYIQDKIKYFIPQPRKKDPSDHFKKSTVTVDAKTKMDSRDELLGRGQCFFTFPKDFSVNPFPAYHSIEGTSIFFLDWKAMFPQHTLMCPHCTKCRLRHIRSNVSRNQTLFPLYKPDGTIHWGEVMMYRCEDDQCSKNNKPIKANSAELLASLPAYMRQNYPVDPQYAQGEWHITREGTDELDSVMKTYANGEFYSKKMLQTAGRQYTRMVESYYSRISSTSAKPFDISFDQWLKKFPPSGRSIRQYYLLGEMSNHRPAIRIFQH